MLLLVFVAIAVFVVHSMSGTKDASENVQRSTAIRNAYDDARYEVLNVRYTAELHIKDMTPESRGAFDDAVNDATTAFDHIAEIGDPSDRAVIEELYADTLPALASVQRLFLALERGEPFNEPIPGPDIVERMENALKPNAIAREAEAATALTQMTEAEERALRFTVAVCGIGFLLAVGLLWGLSISSRREANHQYELGQLRTAALTDSLTGLGNHRAFIEELRRQVARATRHNEPLSLALIDIDEFKEVNDTWGHGRGDTVLKEIAKLMDDGTRQEDYAFRIGGDEFALILPHSEGDAAVRAMTNLRLLATKSMQDGRPTLSIGLASVRDCEGDETVLRQQADSALYQAKLQGRNAVVTFVRSADSRPAFPAAKIAAVRTLLADGKMEAAFQPIWGLTGHNLIAHEALARIPAEYDISGPQLAFDIAERIGKSAELDHLCRTTILSRAHEIPEGSLLFVNVSPYTLTHSTFSAASMVREFEEAGVSPERIVLEITEHSTVSVPVIAAAAATLRAAGFKIALDDVGAGNAGLQMLRRVPVEYVKIDRSVLVSALDDPMGRAAVMAIVAFASQSGALVVAEGIEDSAMLELVRWIAEGGDDADEGLIYAVQGYLLGYPSAVLASGEPPDQLAAA